MDKRLFLACYFGRGLLRFLPEKLGESISIAGVKKYLLLLLLVCPGEPMGAGAVDLAYEGAGHRRL